MKFSTDSKQALANYELAMAMNDPIISALYAAKSMLDDGAAAELISYPFDNGFFEIRLRANGVRAAIKEYNRVRAYMKSMNYIVEDTQGQKKFFEYVLKALLDEAALLTKNIDQAKRIDKRTAELGYSI